MNKKQLDYFQNKLVSEKIQILEQINNSKRNMDVDHSGDEVDLIQANQILEIDSQLSNRNSQRLKSIGFALERIAEETFGECEDCGEEIPEKRLMFNTCFTTCVKCAEEREFEANQRIKER